MLSRPILFRDGYSWWPSPSQIPYAVSLRMLFVHRSCRDIAGIARAVGAAISSKDESDRPIQHKQSRVKLVGVRLTIHVWFHCALAELIALAPKVGFKFGSTHRDLTFADMGQPRVPLHDGSIDS